MTEKQRQVLLQKIYLADASCEVPKAPEIYTRPWKPNVDVQIATTQRGLTKDSHVVELTVTVTAKLDEDVAFLVEVKQAGIFEIHGIEKEEERMAALGGYCPGILFPYLRESVSELVQRAGFPQLLLQPMNFEGLYQQHRKQAAKPAEVEAETTH